MYYIKDFKSYQIIKEQKHNSVSNEEKIQMKTKEIYIIFLSEKGDILLTRDEKVKIRLKAKFTRQFKERITKYYRFDLKERLKTLNFYEKLRKDCEKCIKSIKVTVITVRLIERAIKRSMSHREKQYSAGRKLNLIIQGLEVIW
jgi:hypothetical protein